jgi:hypothetical protein
MAAWTIAMLTTVGVAQPASATTDTYFQFPNDVLSRQFRDGNCIYKISYGDYGNMPYAQLRLFAGDCGTDLYPLPIVTLTWSGGERNTPSVYGGSEPCGSFIGIQVVGGSAAIGHPATGMYVYFPRTDSRKRFVWHLDRDTTTPAGPFC